MRNKDWKMCGAKNRFKDYRKAKRRADQLKLRVYHCPICRDYHFTSQKDKK